MTMTDESMHSASKEMVPHAPATNYRLKMDVSIMLRCHLCSICYTTLVLGGIEK